MKNAGMLEAWVSRVVSQPALGRHVLGYELASGLERYCVFGHLMELAVARGMVTKERIAIGDVQIVEKFQDGGVTVETLAWLLQQGATAVFSYDGSVRTLPMSLQVATGVDPFRPLQRDSLVAVSLDCDGITLTDLNDVGALDPIRLGALTYQTYH